MTLYYLIAAFFFSLINLGILQFVQPRRVSTFYPYLFAAVTIALAGHVFLAMSTNIQEALLANKFAYLGSVFLPLFLVVGIINTCGIKQTAKRIILWSLPSIIVLILASTAGFNEIYYKNPQLIQHFGVSDYTTEFGPAHIFYNLFLVGYTFIGVGILLYALIKKKNVSFWNLLPLALVGSITIIAFEIAREFSCDMIVIPGIYVIIEWLLLSMMHRVEKYDLEGSILNCLTQEDHKAYITLTYEGRFIGANDVAYEYFPDLKNIHVDSVLGEATPIERSLNKVVRCFSVDNPDNSQSFQIGENFFKCNILSQNSNNRYNDSFLLQIEDDTKIHQHIQLLDNYNNQLNSDLKDQSQQIQDMQKQMILGIADVIESRDSSTGSHVKRASQCVKIIVDEMLKDKTLGLTTKFATAVVKAAPMHDIGKIAVDDQILRKPGKFNAMEYSIMKTHAEKGAAIIENMLKDIESPYFVRIARNVAGYHHEHWDGDGYPSNLVAEEIPLEARIMAVADVYDALVSARCYKNRYSYEEAYQIIEDSMGTHFDPRLRPYFERSRKALEDYYDSLEDVS